MCITANVRCTVCGLIQKKLLLYQVRSKIDQNLTAIALTPKGLHSSFYFDRLLSKGCCYCLTQRVTRSPMHVLGDLSEKSFR